MRRKLKTKKALAPDYKYNSEKVTKLINYMMYSGKKSTSERNIYNCFEIINSLFLIRNLYIDSISILNLNVFSIIKLGFLSISIIILLVTYKSLNP